MYYLYKQIKFKTHITNNFQKVSIYKLCLILETESNNLHNIIKISKKYQLT